MVRWYLFFLTLVIATPAISQITKDAPAKILPKQKSVVGSAAVSIAENIIIDLLINKLSKNKNDKNNTVFGSNNIGFNKLDTTSLINSIKQDKGRVGKNADAQLSSFSVEGIARANNIMWSTNSERNVGGYMVERAADNENYTAVGSIEATNTQGLQKYIFTDSKIIDTVKYNYRLRLIWANGQTQTFTPIPVNTKTLSGVVSYLDKATKQLFINATEVIKKIEILDTDAKIILIKKKINMFNPIDISTLLPAVYTARVYTDDSIVSQLFFKVEF